MTISAYAPFNVSYAQRTPYISVTEYENAPTAIDINNLIPGGDARVQQQALKEIIGRASSWIDQFTCGAWGTLAATQNVENGRVWGNRLGQLIVHPKYWPILSVDAFAYGLAGAGQDGNYWGASGDWNSDSFNGSGYGGTTASITPAGNIWVEPQQFVVVPSGATTWNVNSSYGIGPAEYFARWTYTNGWPISTLSASAVAGAASISVTTVTGIYPGTMLTLYDMPNDEQIQVAPNYTIGASVVPLTMPLQFNHQSTAVVTNLPPAVKQAAILATNALIKQRGSGALVVHDIGEVTQTEGHGPQSNAQDWGEAEDLLRPYRMTFVGY
jgi:hypothetical protein